MFKGISMYDCKLASVCYGGFSHGVITLKIPKIYQGKQKTAAILDCNKMVASMASSENAKRHLECIYVESGKNICFVS